jgi:predicted RNA binding protein YcfA (HicA-like mRNA interferase family)
VDADFVVGIITTMKSRDVIKRLEADGWVLSRIKGSHHQFRHPTRPGLVTVPHPKSEIPKGTFLSIVRQASWKQK